MEKLKEKIKRLFSKEQIEKYIYCIFCIMIFFTPVIPDVRKVGAYSLKGTIFNYSTVITSILLILINIKNVKNMFNIKKIKGNIYNVLLLIYLIFVILSAVFSEYGLEECFLGKNGRGEGVITICSYIATFVIFSKGYKHMRHVAKTAIIAVIVVCIYAFIQVNFSDGKSVLFVPAPWIDGNATGTMNNPNFFSSYMCIFLPMSCYYFINGKKRVILALIISTVMFFGLVYSITLGGYLTFIFMLATIIIFSLIFSKSKKQIIFRTLILILTLIGSFAAVNHNNTQVYIDELCQVKQESIKLANGDGEFGTGRMQIWRKSIMVINNHPWLGVGPDSIAKELSLSRYITADPMDILKHNRIDKAHSEPLHIAATTGVPSAIVYVVFVGTIGIQLLVMVIKRTRKNGIEDNICRYITMVLICFASYLVQSIINISVVQVAPMFWAVLGTAAGIVINEKQNKEIITY